MQPHKHLKKSIARSPLLRSPATLQFLPHVLIQWRNREQVEVLPTGDGQNLAPPIRADFQPWDNQTLHVESPSPSEFNIEPAAQNSWGTAIVAEEQNQHWMCGVQGEVPTSISQDVCEREWNQCVHSKKHDAWPSRVKVVQGFVHHRSLIRGVRVPRKESDVEKL